MSSATHHRFFGATIGIKRVYGVACIAAAAAWLAPPRSASASTVYSDQFGRGTTSVPQALNGSEPSPIDTASAIWAASPNITTNGDSADFNTSSNDDDTAFLPLAVSSGNVYSLTATLIPNAGSTGNWLALALVDGNTGVTSPVYTGAAAFVLYRDAGQIVAFSPGLSNEDDAGTAASGSADTFTITLNTTSGLSTASYSITDSQDLVDDTGTVNLVSNPVNDIAISSHGVLGAIESVVVTATPEPATLGLLSVTAMGLLARRRRTN